MSNSIYWIWLSIAGGYANPDYALLIEHFKDAKSIYDADMAEYARVDGLKKETAKALTDKNLDRAREILEFCDNHNVRVLNCSDPDYPVKLKWIYAYPAVLYVYGELPNLNEQLTVAVVGTRKYTDYGRIAAYKIGGGLARAKAVVISGLAEGNDSIAQLACLENGGKTIAVTGTGIDKIYPWEHRELAKRIAKNGAIVTEYPPGAKTWKWSFPQRNRIISGLSDAVVIVEAPKGSGALITTKFATEQNRGVYAVPGDITSPTSYGPLSLIKDGAKPVTGAADIIEDFVYQYSYLSSVLENTDFNIKVPAVTDTTFGTGRPRPVINRISEAKSAFLDNREPYGFESHAWLKNDGKEFTRGRKDRKESVRDSGGIRKSEHDSKDRKESGQGESGSFGEAETESICAELSPAEKYIYIKILKSGKLNAEALVCGEYDTAEVMTALTKLEIQGLIKALPGGFYKHTL